MENMIWLQFGGFFVAVLGLGLAGIVYLTRQFNRLADRMGNLEQRQTRLEERVDQRFDRMEERFDRMEESLGQLLGEVKNLGEGLQNVEKEQARMLGYLEGRGVMGKAPADIETVS